MLPEERKECIYRHIFTRRSATIKELAKLMSVSEMTIRRDIRGLEEEGLIIGIHGGARLNAVIHHELPYADKAQLHAKAKKKLGQFAASLVQEGQVVYLDAGTTSYEIARQLGERFHLTVITNDFSIAAYLMHKAQVNLFHTGGRVDKRNMSGVGFYAASVIERMNIDIAFLSASSWDLIHGISTPYEEKQLVKNAVISSSARSYLVADSSKYGSYGFYSVCSLEKLQGVITDEDIGETLVEEMNAHGVNLHLVNIA
ncbi:DeoR/GlpR family DNA-binding transcription regulator [Cedecea neteri]|uniref:DeoR/GlpR family DNA-binding transcription regulator n=1 Tax=Cedecea neteri TaxID=158822 RepID=UPI002892E7B8|nr:DeoR/GlpR family DNA-binding transcription regulator [Cedecea neteri]WNJ78028.1 DeoR/GlpR family DNA-binding transcription regulator [Cedecea neteri]